MGEASVPPTFEIVHSLFYFDTVLVTIPSLGVLPFLWLHRIQVQCSFFSLVSLLALGVIYMTLIILPLSFSLSLSPCFLPHRQNSWLLEMFCSTWPLFLRLPPTLFFKEIPSQHCLMGLRLVSLSLGLVVYCHLHFHIYIYIFASIHSFFIFHNFESIILSLIFSRKS